MPLVRSKPQLTVTIASPVGSLSLTASDGFLTSIGFVPDRPPEEWPENAVLAAAALQLRRYFEDPEVPFSLPLAYSGTAFMRRVRTALLEIPKGRTETYGSLARRLGSGPRAVAAACRANPYAIVVPCHRVVSAQGLGGYCGHTAGPMTDIKRWLLHHEGCPRC